MATTAWVLAAVALVACLALAGDGWAQETSQPVPTMVRVVEAPLCSDVRLPSGLVAVPECVCSPGVYCLDRATMEAAEAVRRSEAACRGDLKACRDQPPIVAGEGWETWEVVLLVVGVGLGAAGAGIGVGVVLAQ